MVVLHVQILMEPLIEVDVLFVHIWVVETLPVTSVNHLDNNLIQSKAECIKNGKKGFISPISKPIQIHMLH